MVVVLVLVVVVVAAACCSNATECDLNMTPRAATCSGLDLLASAASDISETNRQTEQTSQNGLPQMNRLSSEAIPLRSLSDVQHDTFTFKVAAGFRTPTKIRKRYRSQKNLIGSTSSQTTLTNDSSSFQGDAMFHLECENITEDVRDDTMRLQRMGRQSQFHPPRPSSGNLLLPDSSQISPKPVELLSIQKLDNNDLSLSSKARYSQQDPVSGILQASFEPFTFPPIRNSVNLSNIRRRPRSQLNRSRRTSFNSYLPSNSLNTERHSISDMARIGAAGFNIRSNVYFIGDDIVMCDDGASGSTHVHKHTVKEGKSAKAGKKRKKQGTRVIPSLTLKRKPNGETDYEDLLLQARFHDVLYGDIYYGELTHFSQKVQNSVRCLLHCFQNHCKGDVIAFVKKHEDLFPNQFCDFNCSSLGPICNHEERHAALIKHREKNRLATRKRKSEKRLALRSRT